MIEFDESLCKDLAAAKNKEWLVSNGIGGYSSCTVAGLNTRRYHFYQSLYGERCPSHRPSKPEQILS